VAGFVLGFVLEPVVPVLPLPEPVEELVEFEPVFVVPPVDVEPLVEVEPLVDVEPFVEPVAGLFVELPLVAGFGVVVPLVLPDDEVRFALLVDVAGEVELGFVVEPVLPVLVEPVFEAFVFDGFVFDEPVPEFEVRFAFDPVVLVGSSLPVLFDEVWFDVLPEPSSMVSLCELQVEVLLLLPVAVSPIGAAGTAFSFSW
jgi:hypothetical protein